jgi:hypothetical protein
VKSDDRLTQIARRYAWWSEPERTLADNMPRLVAQVMEMGTWEDAHALLDIVGAHAFRSVLHQPPPGVFSPKSWVFWHRRLGMGEAPELKSGREIPPQSEHRVGRG